MTNLSGKIWLVDSMILVACVNEEHVNHAKVLKLFKSISSGEVKVVISSQNILEYSTVLIKGYKLPAKEVAKSVKALFSDSNFSLIYPNSVALEDYATRLSNTALHPTDCFLMTTLLANGVDSIITDDRDFLKIKELTVYNPFLWP